jgi:hypothetical protein
MAAAKGPSMRAKVLWFVGLWAGSVAAVALLAYVIRYVIG